MDNSAAYLIMILSPLLWLVSKLSVHYTIMYDIIRKKHSKSYVKKNSGNLFEKYFLWNFKNEIKPLPFYSNALLGLLVIIGSVSSIVYLFLAAIGYELHIFILPTIVCWFDIFLCTMRIFRQISDRLTK